MDQRGIGLERFKDQRGERDQRGKESERDRIREG